MVEIDISSCENPFECQKCVQACPLSVIALDPVEVEGFEVVRKWRVISIYKDLCNGCNRCVEACPEGRITVNTHGEVNVKKGQTLIKEDKDFQEYLAKKGQST
jgi:formate hydrogenlyase subunit 6/NADH:ubiquinone oxidoreductase subunit I